MADWGKVMFCNENTFRLVLRGYKLVHRPLGVSRYDSRYIIKTVKHPKSVMVWGDFSGDKGREGTLAQLKTNKSPFLLSYIHKINASTHPSPLCPLCRTHEHIQHTTQHLFSCP